MDRMTTAQLVEMQARTGGLSRIIERGVKGIETIVRFTILNTVPTLIEFVLTAAIFWWGYGFSYLGVTAFTVWIYIWFTIRASDWRIAIRRSMNDSDTDANTKAIDSLLNFETVKYFGAEAREKRFVEDLDDYSAIMLKALADRLAEPQPAGRCRVVMHTMVLQYLSDDDRRQIAALLSTAGRRAWGGTATGCCVAVRTRRSPGDSRSTTSFSRAAGPPKRGGAGTSAKPSSASAPWIARSATLIA